MKKRILAILLSTAMMVQALGVIPAMAIEATPETEIAEEETAEALPAEETEAVAPEETEAPEETAAPEETVAPAPTKAPAMAPMALGDEDYGVAPQEMDDEDEGIALQASYDGIVEETTIAEYNKITQISDITNGTYVIYSNKANGFFYPTNNDIAVKETNYTSAPDKLTNVSDSDVWTVTVSGSNYTFRAPNGKYMNIVSGDVTLDDSQNLKIKNNTNKPGSISIYRTITFIISADHYARVMGTNVANSNVGENNSLDSSMYLYKKGNPFTAYKVTQSAIDSLTANVLGSDKYTIDSWMAYEIALSDARGKTFATDAEAYEAYQALAAAINDLERVAESIIPEITWRRTNEPASTSRTNYGKLIVGVPYIPNTDANYSTITWGGRVDDILKLTTDSGMTVWDYGTSNQYASDSGSNAVKKVAGITAATWNEHEQNNTGVVGWQNASVRLFDGTFTWPEGYTLDDFGSISSVNDSNYQDIYDAIVSDPELERRFANSKVIAVNDDMFVFVYKDGETLTANNYLDHLVFWSGSSGKGLWCSDPNGRDSDWIRTTPAVFNNISANPSYYQTMPNNADIDNSITARVGRNKNDMNFSGGWYTLVDTSSIMTTFKNLYGSENLAGQKMHIAIYCFDNSGTGGMDKLELKLTKKAETKTNVEVRYWLNEVSDKNSNDYLGSSYINDVSFGEEINLTSGTNINELNYRKSLAIARNGNGDVENGIQSEILVVSRDSENVVNVIYTSKNLKVITLTADSGEFVYDGTAKTLNKVKVEEAGQSVIETTAANGVALYGGNYIHNIAAVKSATNPGIYEVNFGTNRPFVSSDVNGNAENALSNYNIRKNNGTLTITYAPVEATVTYDFAVANEYDILNAVEKLADVTENSDNVEIDEESKAVLYIPDSVKTSEDVTLTLTFEGGYETTKTIHFVAASNVLYEAEDFLSGAGWDVTGEAADTVVDDNEDSVFGFADAYDEEYEYSNNAAMYATLDASAAFAQTAPLTFTFKGTGFDLISECSDNTGILFVQVTGNGVNKAYMVDTYFSREDAYQVPVVRNLDLPYGEYNVTVTGMIYQSAGAVSSKARVATYALSDPAQDAVDAILAKVGYTGSDLTVSFADENSVLNGGSGSPALAPKAATTGTTNSITSFFSKLFGRSGASTLSLDPEDGGAGSEGIYAYVDAFRVYQPAGSAEPAVYGDEAGTKFYSLYDFVCASADEIDFVNNAFIYREYDEDMQMSQIAAYKEQGPENEIYLKPGAQIAFVLNNYNEGDVVQIGAKAVTEGAILNDGAALSMTEMYYDVKVNTAPEVGAYVLIENNGESGILAVNTLKVSSGITCSATQTLVNKLENTTEEEAFVPQNFTATYTAAVKSGKATAISIKASVADVARVEVKDASGNVLKTYTKDNATNSLAVSLGMSSSYTYSYTTAKITASTSYNIVAYNADGVASEPIAVTINLK